MAKPWCEPGGAVQARASASPLEKATSCLARVHTSAAARIAHRLRQLESSNGTQLALETLRIARRMVSAIAEAARRNRSSNARAKWAGR